MTLPSFCPLRGKPAEAVRNIAGHMFEMLCEACKRPCVVLMDDFMPLEQPDMKLDEGL